MDALTTALSTSVLGTFRVFVVLLVGILASKWPRNEPLLTTETCRSFSRTCALLFLPALVVSSTGATLNPAALRDAWQLLAAGSFTIGVSIATARAGEQLFFQRAEDRRAFRPVGLAITFANSAGFPLLLMDALCEQDNIKSDFDDDAVECFTQATGMIFIYVVIWQVYFFGWGFFALGNDGTLEHKLTGQLTESRTLPKVGREASSHGESGDPLPHQAEQGEHGIKATSWQERASVGGEIEPCTGETSQEMSTANDDESCGVDGERSWAELRKRILRLLLSPNIIAVTIGVVIAMIPPLQRMLFVNPRAMLRPLGAALETIGDPEVAISTIVMAGSLVQVPTVAFAATATHGGQGDAAQRWRRFRILAGFLHVVCRLVVVPTVGFTAFWLARTHSSVMGENRLMHLILLIEFAMPSAAFVIVSLNQMRFPATAGFIARLYLWQYGASMFTITAWIALAVHLVY
eukprot:g14742.t1